MDDTLNKGLGLLSGVRVHAVDVGTILREGDAELTVEDGRAVTKGGEVYLSHRDYAALLAQAGEKS